MDTFCSLVLSGGILTAQGLIVRKVEWVDYIQESVIVKVGSRPQDIIRVPLSSVRPLVRSEMRPETLALLGV